MRHVEPVVHGIGAPARGFRKLTLADTTVDWRGYELLSDIP